jgi:hypothetical protein
MTARIGGSRANGSTNRDRTNYLQTVPNDALEKMIWAEADKLGYFINTVTEPVLAKEKQVVKNENANLMIIDLTDTPNMLLTATYTLKIIPTVGKLLAH